VRTDLWEAGAAMDHINLLKWADVVVLCPATANTINAFAAGLAPDLVGALFLAHDWRKPYLLAPAMNPAMWAHPATVASLEKLRGWGVRILPVGRGRLACGDEGEGRLLEPDAILDAIRTALPAGATTATNGTRAPVSSGRTPRVLITAGGTEEPIDGVRSIGNFSTGRTGALLADAFAAAGCDVTLLRARRAFAPATSEVRQEIFSSFADLEATLRRLLAAERYDTIVHAAAVSDYSVADLVVNGHAGPAPATGKLDSGRDIAVRLKPNPKLVDSLRTWSANPRLRVIAFKLTRGADAAAARAAVDTLFAHSHADFVVHNDLTTLDEATGRFPATIFSASGAATPVESRVDLAAALGALLAPTN
jgi:phosphopantothenoylcysteine decarboxylase / phosphopantothenate---cysteine ligase